MIIPKPTMVWGGNWFLKFCTGFDSSMRDPLGYGLTNRRKVLAIGRLRNGNPILIDVHSISSKYRGDSDSFCYLVAFSQLLSARTLSLNCAMNHVQQHRTFWKTATFLCRHREDGSAQHGPGSTGPIPAGDPSQRHGGPDGRPLGHDVGDGHAVGR